MNEQVSKNLEFALVGAAFALFLAVISYQLTNAGLWYDETIEYWYSKYFIGQLPWADGFSNMYQRIVITYQPPLFNVLLHFWLLISDSEWWMRMFGVAMGLVGAFGVYKSMNFGTRSRILAAVSVVLYAMIFRLTYYWQEVAEYALMLGLLSWTVYWFLKVVRSASVKNIIVFIIFCILPVYSQYGAVFPVCAFLLLALIRVLSGKNRRNKIAILTGYAVSLVGGGIPLYWFFLRKQMIHQGSNSIDFSQRFSIRSLCQSFVTIFQYDFVSGTSATGDNVLKVVLVVMVILSVAYILRGRRVWLRYLLLADIITYVIFYAAVFVGAYASVSLDGYRYDVFLIPVMFVSGFLLIYAVLTEWVARSKFKRFQEAAPVLGGIVAVGLSCWGFLGWNAISENWEKEDVRGAVQEWVKQGGRDVDTIVYHSADPGFAYYAIKGGDYGDDVLQNVVFQPIFDINMSKDYYREWVDSVYDEWPQSLYIFNFHAVYDDIDSLVGVFTDEGYTSSSVYSNRCGKLIYLEYGAGDV